MLGPLMLISPAVFGGRTAPVEESMIWTSVTGVGRPQEVGPMEQESQYEPRRRALQRTDGERSPRR